MRTVLAKNLRVLVVVALVLCVSGHTQGSGLAAQTRLTGPAHSAARATQQQPAVLPTAITYTFSVDKARPNVTDSLIYTITVWNSVLQTADTLRRVEAEFLLPRFLNGTFALQLATFHYNGPYPFTVDAAQGKITWQIGDLVRHTPRLPQDTARVVFSLRLADVSAFGLACGENPISAAARVSFLSNGQRIYPGTEQSALSTLELAADFVASRVTNSTTTLRRGEVLTRSYAYHNAGNIARDVRLCLQIPAGFEIDKLRVEPSTFSVQRVANDSLCILLGNVAADAHGVVTLHVPVAQDLPPSLETLCLRGTLLTDCDRVPANNFYQQDCFRITPLDLLAITKTAQRNEVQIGDTLIYTLRFANVDSFVTAWQVAITDVLPAGAQLLFADTTATFVNGVLTWRRAALLPLQSGVLRVIVRVQEDYYTTQAPQAACTGAVLSNRVSITSKAQDGSPSPESPERMANNSSAANVSLRPLGDALALEQSLTALPPANLARLLPGDTLLVVLQYANRNATLIARNVTLLDSLPEARFAQLVPPLPPGFVYDAANNTLRRENFVLAPNESATASFRLVLRNENALCTTLTLQNRARIFSPTTIDCRTDNNIAVRSATLPGQQNLLQLRVQAPSFVAPDSVFTIALQYSNVSDLPLQNIVAREALPYPFVVQTINNGGALAVPNQIVWQIGALAPRASGTVSVRVAVRDTALCEAMAATNFAWISSDPRDCDTRDDSSRTVITIAASPAEAQARLLVQRIEVSEANRNGCVEVGERVVARVYFVNVNRRNLTATQINFRNTYVRAGARTAPMTLIDLVPASVAPQDTGMALFEFVISENDFTADTLLFFGTITAENFCAQSYANIAGSGARFCPVPQVEITRIDINDDNGDRDGFASEGETLNTIVVFQNTGPLAADSVDATITLSLPGFLVLRASPASVNTFPIHLRRRLTPGQSDSVAVQVRYDNFSFTEQTIVLTAFLQVTALAGPQPPRSDQILIRRDCFARPNPFIPSHHPLGVRFAPNDGEPVKIFDMQGQLVRALRTSQTWDGRDESGALCQAGLYVWKIAGACEGTIVVVR